MPMILPQPMPQAGKRRYNPINTLGYFIYYKTTSSAVDFVGSNNEILLVTLSSQAKKNTSAPSGAGALVRTSLNFKDGQNMSQLANRFRFKGMSLVLEVFTAGYTDVLEHDLIHSSALQIWKNNQQIGLDIAPLLLPTPWSDRYQIAGDDESQTRKQRGGEGHAYEAYIPFHDFVTFTPEAPAAIVWTNIPSAITTEFNSTIEATEWLSVGVVLHEFEELDPNDRESN